MRKSLIYIISVFFAALLSYSAAAQMLLPKSNHLVNDYAGILSQDQTSDLEKKLVAFNDSTSTQIAIVIVNDLQGYDRSEFAQKVASDWGIGVKGKNNGLLILVKPKTENSAGKAFISTGYGLEGVIPDLICAEIIDREMIPRFRENDYYGGLEAATNVLMSLAAKEFTAGAYHKEGGKRPKTAFPVGGLIFLIIIFIVIVSSKGSNNHHIGRGGSSGLPFWMLMSMMGSGRSHGGSWGGFSDGGGFSGGGGGFGGFGGGGFGGGGAGGSW